MSRYTSRARSSVEFRVFATLITVVALLAVLMLALHSLGGSPAAEKPVYKEAVVEAAPEPTAQAVVPEVVAPKVEVPEDTVEVTTEAEPEAVPLVAEPLAAEPVAAVGVAKTAKPVVPAVAVPAAVCQEDDPCWDCRTMGSRLCGPQVVVPDPVATPDCTPRKGFMTDPGCAVPTAGTEPVVESPYCEDLKLGDGGTTAHLNCVWAQVDLAVVVHPASCELDAMREGVAVPSTCDLTKVEYIHGPPVSGRDAPCLYGRQHCTATLAG